MSEREPTADGALRALDAPPGGDAGRLVLVAASAGTGKTALLVQLAIDALLHDLPVLHVSVGETLAHTKRWYQDVYRELAAGRPADAVRREWDRLEPRRLLMAFRPGAFTVERLQDRVRLLEAQGVFSPRRVMVDGLVLRPEIHDTAQALGRFAAERQLELWLAARAPHDTDPLEALAAPLADLFHTVVALEPQADGTALRVLKGLPLTPALRLDPSTLLLRGS